MEYQKIKSVAKEVHVKSKAFDTLVGETMRIISDIVGGTLGPGGRPVLIERQEFNLPPIVTKDGVTVFKSLGFANATQHVIMECARDAAIRTANEAGDGTTTSAILAESIMRYTREFCKKNPTISPQKVVRKLEEIFLQKIEPWFFENSIQNLNLEDPDSRELLKSVATISANGDVKLAEAVMECYDIVGDEGNVTILECSGPSHYEVEPIKGYSISMGYESSCGVYYPKFINDPGTARCVMFNPVFIVYHGRINDIQSCLMLLEQIGRAWQDEKFNHNVVLVATGFSESVLGQLAINFAEPTSINVFPLLTPQFPYLNGQLDFLTDVCAITGAKLLDCLNNPIEHATLDDLGIGPTEFECHRFRSTIVGRASEEGLLQRVEQLKQRLQNPESILEKRVVEERLGKLTGGIAKLRVIGSSGGETKEKRDRAEDAVCAVRGALKSGCVWGGGWALAQLWKMLNPGKSTSFESMVVEDVLCPSILEPLKILYKNSGMTENEVKITLDKMLYYDPSWDTMLEGNVFQGDDVVYDVLNNEWVSAKKAGIVDSVPAVFEALKNSLSIASLLGTLSGTVVFARDVTLERTEATETANFLRQANMESPANERP